MPYRRLPFRLFNYLLEVVLNRLCLCCLWRFGKAAWKERQRERRGSQTRSGVLQWLHPLVAGGRAWAVALLPGC